MGVFVWVEVVDHADFFDNSRSYRWAVEGGGRVILSAGPFVHAPNASIGRNCTAIVTPTAVVTREPPGS
jgi:hypothetical protein